MKKTLVRLFISAFAVIMLISGSLAVSAAWNPYPSGTCTWYAWRATKEITGVTLPGLGNAEDWYANAAAAGFSVGKVPKANSVIVFKDIGSATSGYGHVAFVRSVRGSTMDITEGSYRGRYVHEDTISANAVRWSGGYRQAIIGYIYVTEKVIVVPKVTDAVASALLNNEIKLMWPAVEDATGYEIFRWNADDENFDKVGDIAGTLFRDTNLQSGKAYTYKVKAYIVANGILIKGSASAKLKSIAMDISPASLKEPEVPLTINDLIQNIPSGAESLVL